MKYDNGNAVQDNDKYSQTVATYIKGIASKIYQSKRNLRRIGKY